MKITDKEFEGYIVLQIDGELDLYNGPDLRSRITELLNAGQSRVILDMQKVSYIDSSGFSALLDANKRLKEKGELHVVGMSEAIRKLFDTTKIAQFFSIHDFVEDVVMGL